MLIGAVGERPVARAHRLGLLGPATLAVHLLHVDSSEVETLAATRTSVCVCPRSNWELHGRLPEISSFLLAGSPVHWNGLAGDCASVNLFDEMRFVAERYRDLSPRTIVALGTTQGAKALGRSDLGSVTTGQTARLIYVDLMADSADTAALNLVSGNFGCVEWL